jgi:hypothetical protein
MLIGKPAQAGLAPLQDGRQTKTQPQNPPTGPAPANDTLSSLATGQDNPLATPGGMDFTAGNF